MNEKTRKVASEKLLRCALALLLATTAMLSSAIPAFAKSNDVQVTIGDSIPYAGYFTTHMAADGNIAYCADPTSATPAPGTYSKSPVTEADLTAAMWYSYGAPGFDPAMFPSSWYDGSDWNEDKYIAASHVLLAYVYQGSKSDATYGTDPAFDTWADSELLGTTWQKMKESAGRVSAGFEAFLIPTGSSTQVLESFTWDTGGLKIAKVDDEAGNGPQGDGGLAGAAFDVVNSTGKHVYIDGKYFAQGETVKSIETKWDPAAGKYTAQASGLPCGSYTVVESAAPKGYTATESHKQVDIVENGQTVDLTGEPLENEVIRGGVQVVKSDKELEASEAIGGKGHGSATGPNLNGIEFTITNMSASGINVDGEWHEPGSIVMAISTAWNEEAGAYTAQTKPDALPYGTYSIQETATNDSYLLSDGTPRTFQIREAGKVVTASPDGGSLEFYDQVVRNDLEIHKKAEETNASLQVPFLITNVTTGEQHVIVTDRNGDASTASSWNKHSNNTNANDALIGMEGITAADMDTEAGIWFSIGENGSAAPVDDSLSALPYGEYTLTELPCEANEGFVLIEKTFWIECDSTAAKAVWMNLDNQDGPRIGTTATVEDGSKQIVPGTEVTIVDEVAYENLDTSKTYELVGTLMDKSTGKAVLDAAGNAVTSTVEFTPSLSTGTQKVEFTFDASLLGKTQIVAFESLRCEGIEVAAHADIEDGNQTVELVPEIGTKAFDKADGDQTIMAGDVEVVDVVSYAGLIPGETYSMQGTIIDKSTGEPLAGADGSEITSSAEFVPEAASGEIEVTFSFNTGDLAEGTELVVFEKCLDAKGNVIATHEDIESADQTVTVKVPETPEEPQEPAEPEKPAEPEEPYAKTGATAPDPVFGAAMIAATAAVAIGGTALAIHACRKDREDEKESEGEEVEGR